MDNAFGPLDYRTASSFQRELVEGAHFTSDVEALRKGSSATRAGPDIDYTLRAFPNHPRALRAVTRLYERAKKDPPPGVRYTVNCWFERAVHFAPDDGLVRVLYGNFLADRGERAAAALHLSEAARLAGDNANIHYNLGLGHLKLMDYDKSLVHAHQAYRLGFPAPGLRNMLIAAGRWKEPSDK